MADTGIQYQNGHAPASFIDLKQLAGAPSVDPAAKIGGMPPNFGEYALPHAQTFQGILGSVAKVFRPSDEALKHNYHNARAMRTNVLIRECIDQRQRSTALLNWHLEPEDATSPTQKQLADELTQIIKRIPRFMQYRENLLHALWFGRYGVSQRYRWKPIAGKMRICIDQWNPIHGDKIVFRFDDGTKQYDPDQIGIRVHSAFQLGQKIGDNTVEKLQSPEPTDYGLAYFLQPYQRSLVALHRHQIEDGEYEEPQNAGRVHGVGIRNVVYWSWYQQQECLALLIEYVERSALGIELWYYPFGNAEAEAKTRKAAQERLGEGRNVILVPRPVGDTTMAYGVDRIEPGAAGADAIRTLITDYFGHAIKRYILGQTLTSEAGSTGLGSNLADVHLNTYLQIVRYDATNLEETLTTDLVEPLKLFNFPKLASIPVYFKIDTEAPDVEGKLQAWRTAFDMGVKLKAQDVMDLIGASKPGQNDEVLDKLQQAQQGMPMDGGEGPDGGSDRGGGIKPGDRPKPFGPLGDTVHHDTAHLFDDLRQKGMASNQSDDGADEGSQVSRYRKLGPAEWKEDEHPREADGQFAEKSAGADAPARKKTAPLDKLAQQLALAHKVKLKSGHAAQIKYNPSKRDWTVVHVAPDKTRTQLPDRFANRDEAAQFGADEARRRSKREPVSAPGPAAKPVIPGEQKPLFETEAQGSLFGTVAIKKGREGKSQGTLVAEEEEKRREASKPESVKQVAPLAGQKGLFDGEASASASAPNKPEKPRAKDWHYATRHFLSTGKKQKFHDNMEAVRTLKSLELEGRPATEGEQEKLSKYVGWGQFPELFSYHGDWSKERSEFRSLVGEDEYESARRATTNSHFTAPDVIAANWKMAERLGFKGGKLLEPAVGAGYYLGMMPEHLADKTKITAVEMDQVSGGIAKALYPNANVHISPFQNLATPDNFYDLVATNVPFSGAVRIADPKYKAMKPTLHDYYFLRAADATKPGGLAMLITSAGTMDKLDSRVRAHLDKNMELVSAVRFPGDTHKENAGTDVVTDLLVLRKKNPALGPAPEQTPSNAEPKEHGFTGTTVDSLGRLYHWVDGKRVPAPDWSSTVQVPSADGKEPITINKYFADHPEQMLGVLDRSGTMYGGNEKNVRKTEDYEDRLQAAIDRLPEGILQAGSAVRAAKEQAEPERLEADRDYNEGQIVLKDGKLYQHDGGSLTPLSVAGKNAEATKGLIGLRDAARDLIAAQQRGEGIDEARKELNRQYDAFTKANGALHDPKNRRLMKGDPDGPFLLSLEKYNGSTKTAEKTDIFSKDTVRHEARATTAGSVAEATGIVLHEAGGIDVDRIAELTGKTPDEIHRELVASNLAYDDPSSGVWQPAAQYLSGNTRQKLREARAAAQLDPQYEANVKALEAHQPPDIDAEEIGVKLGAPWIPGDVLAEFSAEVLGARPEDFRFKYLDPTAEWHTELKNQSVQWRQSNRGVWGVQDDAGNVAADYMDIMDHALSGKPLLIRSARSDDNGNRHVLPEQTEAAREKVEELRSRFKDWLWEDQDRASKLHRHYNDNYNNIVPTAFDGSHLTFPGMRADFQMRDLQKNFVWRVLTTGKGLAAHEVGTGKTASMVAAAMELRRLGLAKKPAIAVLKSNIDQITAEAQELYPGAKILSTSDMFDASKRQQTLNRIATGDYDMVILTHDHLDQMKMKPETSQKFIQEEIDELSDAILSASDEAAAAGGRKKDNRIVKRLENAKMKLEEQLKQALNESNKDDIYFEDTGIDQLFVDEAHNFKSLPCHTRRGEIKGIPSQRSQRATNMLMRTRWLLGEHNGRGVVFATGTPIANTMGELFNMQRYLQFDDLKERNVHKFDSWADTYGDTTNRIEFKLNGDVAPTTRFAEFVNLPELRHLSSQIMDVQRADNLKKPDGSPVIQRPTRHDYVDAAPETEAISKMMAGIHARAEALKGKRRGGGKGEDNMLSVCNDAKLGSIDMRLIDPAAEDNPDSKANRAVRKIVELYHEHPGKTQAVFSDLGIHPNKWNFSVFADMQKKLVAAGIPENEIVDFSDESMKDAKRVDAQKALTRGDARIAFGSTKRLGTGTNIQKNLVAVHHIDIPYVPAYLEQRDGRAYRSGNTNKDIQVYKYVQQGSADNMFWQILANKSHFINQFMLGRENRTMQDLDAETLTPDEMIAVATGDESMLERVQLEDEVRKLRRSQTRHASDQSRYQETLVHAPERLAELEARHQEHAIDAQHVAETPEFHFKAYTGGSYDKRSEAETALASELTSAKERLANQRRYYDDEPVRVGTYRQMPVYLKDDGMLELQGPSGQAYTSGPSIAYLDAAARKIAKHGVEAEQRIRDYQSDLAKMREQLSQPFRHTEALKEKEARLQQLRTEFQNRKPGRSRGEAGEKPGRSRGDAGGSSPQQPAEGGGSSDNGLKSVGSRTSATTEPHELTQQEYLDQSKLVSHGASLYVHTPDGRKLKVPTNVSRNTMLRTAHRQMLINAQAAGKPVSDRVLSDYPELMNPNRQYRRTGLVERFAREFASRGMVARYWNRDQPRGQPDNAGQFASGDGESQGSDSDKTDHADSANPDGPIFHEFRHNATGAVKALMEAQGGEAVAALHHKVLGDIDLIWGDPGDERGGGYGLSHIADEHPEVVPHLQTILDTARVRQQSERRIILRSKKYQAVVSLEFRGNAKRWLLTAFDTRERPDKR